MARHDVELDLALPQPEQLAAIRATFPDRPTIDVALAGMDMTFRCRPPSTDIPVIFDTFVGLYHVPLHALRERPVIVDLGSNIGCTLVHYARLHAGARLYGVELDGANVTLARENLALNAVSAEVLHAAIWPHDGEVRYGGQESWGLQVAEDGHTGVTAISMPSLLERFAIETIDFLKVDIEGGERELFAGDLAWLDRTLSLHVEVHYDASYLQSLQEQLTAHGFAAAPDPRHWSALTATRMSRR
ncbi:MAG: FkbM family methyltransferase [Hyphomicrobiaceae bacterium]